MAFIPDDAVYNSHEISHAAFKLYACYCAHRNNKSGQAWPDRETIHEATKIDVNYVSTLKKELQKAGWIAIEGKRVRPLKGFQVATEKLNHSINELDSKADNDSLPANELANTEKLNDSIITPSDPIEAQPEELNHSIKELNDSREKLNHSISHIRNSEPAEEPVKEPAEVKHALAAPKSARPRDELFEAVAEVCRIDWTLAPEKQRGELNQTTGILRKAKKTPADVRFVGAWWWVHDWRGKQGDAPSPSQIREVWQKAMSWEQTEPLIDNAAYSGLSPAAIETAKNLERVRQELFSQ